MRCGKKHINRKSVLDILLVLLLISGLATLAVLNGQAWYARYLAETSITELSSKSDNLGDEGRLAVKEQAIAYNKQLAGENVPQDVLPYENQLLFDREPMMSYIEIPKINVRLPIYHGTSEAALMAGIGHLESSSLPIGGTSTHCVLTGHSGMHNTPMFDDLVELESGDMFVIWTLSEPYAYEVTAIETVVPEDTSSLEIEPQSDLCTLVTCTPYGVNSHRLLVHATRCDYEPDEIEKPVIRMNDREQTLAAALALTAAGLLAVIVHRKNTRRRRAAEWRSKCL